MKAASIPVKGKSAGPDFEKGQGLELWIRHPKEI